MASQAMTTDRKENDDHNEDRKEFTIIVNGRAKTVRKQVLTFQEVVKLAFDDPPTGDTVAISVTYRKGPDQNPSGTLIEGQSVKIKDKMVFDVTATNKS